jgi:DNA-binding transcriptional MerR regulator
MVREFLIQEGLYIPTKDLATGAVPQSAANPSAVAAYMGRVGQGPSQELPLFSWEHPVSHSWNVAVIRVLNQKFRTYVTNKGLSRLIQLLGPTASTGVPVADISRALDKAGDVEKLIQEKLEHQQGLLRRAQRKIHSFRGQTELEIEESLKGDLKAARTKARRQERKRNVCPLAKIHPPL